MNHDKSNNSGYLCLLKTKKKKGIQKPPTLDHEFK